MALVPDCRILTLYVGLHGPVAKPPSIPDRPVHRISSIITGHLINLI